MREVLGEVVTIKLEKCDIADGLYDSDKKEITINSEVTNKYRRLYIELHEFVHAVFDRAGINQGPNITEDIEEIIAHTIAICLVENYDIKPKQVD